jgi:glycosyltransferase involved in cell wall biosynthesis
MPAYNEAATIEGVLDDLYPRIDRLIIVDDGSRDATPGIVDRWASGRDRCTVIHFPANRGLSAALRAGWEEVRAMLGRGEIRPDDVAFSIDADGQHEPSALDGMIDHLVATDSVCVIGKRDMGYHTGYKKFGNAVMSWIGSLSGAHPFDDIESGYRVFRVGPLLDAQEFYEGYKYSETVEVAVLLTRLGHKVDNTYGINIPVARTRTRLYDAAVDAVCMPLAWYRLACWRDAPKSARTRLLLLAPALVLALSAIALLLVLSKSFYLGDDSAHSYAHVWYLSEAIFTHHQWPWHISQLENGDAVMFPYGIIPWLPDALLYPILGDWVVTFSMVAGVVLMCAAMISFRPAMRAPVLLAIFLLNPLLWNGITQFQLTTMWSFAFFFFAAGQFEREHNGRSGLLFALAVATHPMMGICALAVYTVWETIRLRALPGRLLALEGIAVLAASPAIVLFLQTPSLSDADRVTIALSTLDNLRRLSIVIIPLALPPLAQLLYRRQRWFVGIGALGTAGALILLPPTGIWQTSQPRFTAYLQQHPIDPNGSYRVAVPNNHEDGMVQFMKAGAVLSNEFFTESEFRQTWPSESAYTCFLATKNIDHVVISGEYDQRFRVSETDMLEALAARGYAQQQFRGSDGTVAYTVQPPASARRASVRDCHT